MKNLQLVLACAFCASSVLLPNAQIVADDYQYSPWSTGVGVGVLFPEGDEEVKRSLIIEGKVGYDVDEHWTVEGSFGYLPNMKAKRFSSPGQVQLNPRYEIANDDTWGLRTAVDGLYHFNEPSNRQWDPFLAATAGVNYTDANLENGQHFDPFAGVGLGLARELTKNWVVRGDYRALVVGHDTEINHHTLVSLGYRWGGAADRSGDADRSGAASEKDIAESQLHVIHFPFDSSQLTAEAQQKLQANARWIKNNSDVNIIIEGHCDERGTAEYNLALGDRRAKAAFSYLQSLGIPAHRMSTISYGEERPAVAESNEAAWAKNRRVVCISE